MDLHHLVRRKIWLLAVSAAVIAALAFVASARWPRGGPEVSAGGVEAISEAQLQEELDTATFRVDHDLWGTDFRFRTVSYRELFGGGLGKDWIPPIYDPGFDTVSQADEWLEDREPVQVARVGHDARAYPIRIMAFHEVVNDTVGGVPVVITHCPLCNTAFVYKRTVKGRTLVFGTTGRLRFSNLVMWDHETESWWQEARGEAIIGKLAGLKLDLLSMSLVSWKEFKTTFPAGRVLSRDTGIYARYDGRTPYAGYDTQLDDPSDSVSEDRLSGADGADFGALVPFFYSAPRDPRLPVMERVLGLNAGVDALAIPYSHLEIEPVMHVDVAGRELAVFFQRGTTSSLDTLKIPEGRDVGATGVFEPVLGDTTLTFRAEGGEIVDRQTGSTWNILGRATSGPLKGNDLTPVVHQGGQLWFSWAAFHPDTVVYGEGQESRTAR